MHWTRVGDSQRILLRILGNFTESRITDLPPNLRILLTSRPLRDIHAALNGRTHVRQKSMDSLPLDLTKRDILRYVSDQLSQVDGFGVPGQEPVSLPLLGHLVKYSSGRDWPVHISWEITMLGRG